MKQSLLFLIVLLLTSCVAKNNDVYYQHGADFNISNNSLKKIDSITVYCGGSRNNLKYIHLNPNETKSFYLDMSNIPQIDGHYILEYKSNTNIPEEIRFGYFTNGWTCEELTKIDILKDTVTFDFMFEDSSY